MHIISVTRRRGLKLGAIGYLTKPVTHEGWTRPGGDQRFAGGAKLLIVEDDEVQRGTIIELIGNEGRPDHQCRPPRRKALNAQDERFDCMVLDLGLPDMAGLELIKKIKDSDVEATRSSSTPARPDP